jgi:hypothetical protein
MNEVEQLLVEVMDVIARRFDKRAVLRGGMVLRVLGCERMTNDVDYVFVPYASKKDGFIFAWGSARVRIPF